MKLAEPITEPLTVYEAERLMSVYNERCRNLWAHFFGGTFLVAFVLFSRLYYIVGAQISYFGFRDKIDWLAHPQFLDGWYLKILVAMFIAAISTYITYQYEMLPFKEDALSGVKYMRTYIIKSKDYYPITDQYFIRIAGIENAQYEMSAAAWHSCTEGGEIIMGEAIKSKFILAEYLEN